MQVSPGINSVAICMSSKNQQVRTWKSPTYLDTSTPRIKDKVKI